MTNSICNPEYKSYIVETPDGREYEFKTLDEAKEFVDNRGSLIKLTIANNGGMEYKSGEYKYEPTNQ